MNKIKTPDEALSEMETYYAPPPPKNGSIIGVDCHPDTFTAAETKGSNPYDLKTISTLVDVSLDTFLSWVAKKFTHKDIFLMEAGGNSFEIYRRLTDLGLRACVLESAHVGKHAKTYADNDKIASLRIASVYLGTRAPAVWVPDSATIQRRELLHLYQRSVVADTQATNALKGYLNQYTLRLKKRPAHAERTEAWVKFQREWSELQLSLLDDHFQQVRRAKIRRADMQRLILTEVVKNDQMLALMGLLGIGKINAFALIATIGDVRRFSCAKKLAAYLGLNPGSRDSGTQKRIKVGAGKRGRKDMRNLLLQGAHAVLRMGRNSDLGKWGWKLFARKGHRNIAVVAVARKLSTQVWHLLMGNKPTMLESNKSRSAKFKVMLIGIGKKRREEIDLIGPLDTLVEQLNLRLQACDCSTWGCHPKPRQAESA